MTALGVALLPSGLARARPDSPARTARIVLTGPGGGTWQTSLARHASGETADGPGDASAATEGSNGSGPVDVRIVVDTIDFCRLVANRMDPAALTAVVSGDGALARDVFVGAASLALD